MQRSWTGWALTVLATVGVLTGGCGAPETAAPTPSSAQVVLLDPGSLGAGWSADPMLTGVPPWPWVQTDCPTYQGGHYTAQEHRIEASQQGYSGATPGEYTHQVIETYESDAWAETAMRDVHGVVGRCGRYSTPAGTISFGIVASDFVGDNAILVRGKIESTDGRSSASWFVSVRRGRIVSTVKVSDTMSEAAVRSLARKLASGQP